MKKKLVFLAAVLSSLVTIQVSANSAPVRMYGYPSATLMSIEESSPIAVEKEVLSFDLSGDSAYHGKVKAAYDMRNTAAGDVTSRMAFPYIGSLWEHVEDETVVTVDGKAVDYTVYIGNAIRGDTMKAREEAAESFDMQRVLESLSEEEYQPRNFDRDAVGRTYVVEAAPTGKDSLSLILRFDMDKERTRVVASGFNGYGRDGDKVELTGWMDRTTVFEIHVQGDDVVIQPEALTIDGKMERSDAFAYTVTVKEEAFEDFLGRHRDSLGDKGSVMHGTGLQNLYLQAIDDGFDSMQGVTTTEELQVADSEDRYLLLLYEVPFSAGESRSVEVSYTTEATVDRSETTVPTYTFTYLLGPAAYWKTFRNLDVEVRTAEHAPYLIGSTMEMEKTGDRVFRANADHLPEGNLVFTLYHKPEITPQDRLEGTLRTTFGYAYPLVLTMLALIVGTAVLLALMSYRQKRKRTA